jgi:hypothetical protein
MNYNPEQLKPMEAAARIYCVKQGEDPDELLPRFAGDLFAPRKWHLAAEDLIRMSMMLTSLKEAADVLPPVQ